MRRTKPLDTNHLRTLFHRAEDRGRALRRNYLTAHGWADPVEHWPEWDAGNRVTTDGLVLG